MTVAQYAYPVFFAVFLWWFSTGVILYLDGLPRRTFRWSLIGATIVFGVSLYGLWSTGSDTTTTGAALAFSFALLAWGWQEITFYMGFITGPRTRRCPDGCAGPQHFWHGVQTCLYHEFAIILTAAVVTALTWDALNKVGLWTFVVLWWMHESAKLNLFFGVRNLNAHFLPEHLQYLRGFLTRKSMNLLFPVSVTISTVVTVLLAQSALAAGATAAEATGYTFLAALMALAVLEHWFLMVPLPAAAMWNWSIRSRAATSVAEASATSVDAAAAGERGETVVRLRSSGDRRQHVSTPFGARLAPAARGVKP